TRQRERTKRGAARRQMKLRMTGDRSKRILAAALLLGGLAALPCAAQAPGAGKGTKQKVANPLNDLLEEAAKEIGAGNYQSATALLEKFIAEKDHFAYAHLQLGYVYTALGRGAEARPEYERALRLDPKMPEAALNLGILLLNQDPAAAVAPLKQ